MSYRTLASLPTRLTGCTLAWATQKRCWRGTAPLLQPRCGLARRNASGAAPLANRTQAPKKQKRMTAEVGQPPARARIPRARRQRDLRQIDRRELRQVPSPAEIMQRDRQRSLDDTGPSAAVAAVDAIKAYKVPLQTHRGPRRGGGSAEEQQGVRARGDVQAVALAAREAKRKTTRKMTKKTNKTLRHDRRKTRRLRLVFERTNC